MKKDQEARHTLGLAMIMKDEIEDLDRIVRDYGHFFDKIYVTVTDKKTHTKLLKKYSENSSASKLQLSYFKWINHFGKARLYNQKQIKTDYWMWIDLDDEILNADLLPALFEQTVRGNLDSVSFAYEYSFNRYGDCVQVFWRERIIRNSNQFKWRDVSVHETISLPKGARRANVKEIVIRHRKPSEAIAASTLKYKQLVVEQWQQKPEPQIGLYLGNSYVIERKFPNALEVFAYVTELGNPGQKAEAYQSMADIHFYTRSYDAALAAVDQAISIDGNRAEPWYLKILIYMSLGEYQKARQAADTLLSLPTPLHASTSRDPSMLTYKGHFLAAKAHLYSGSIDMAYDLFTHAKRLSPGYIEEQSTKFNWTEAFEKVHKNPRIITELLPLPPKRWPKNSLVYFSGPGIESWGPENLEYGIGGSEESVIYLSRELASLGWKITVYCERKDHYTDIIKNPNVAIDYLPWYEMNPRDTFNVFVAGRSALNARNIKATIKLLDLHDAIKESQVLDILPNVNKIMVKSAWHRSLYPNIPDSKIEVIGNGIIRKDFE